MTLIPPLLRSAALRAVSPLLLCAALPAQALPAALPITLADWQCLGACGSSGAQGDVGLSALGSAAYGFVTTAGSDALGASPLALDSNSRGNGTETNGSRLLSPVFSALQGQQVSVSFNYVSTDGKGFDDYAWARVVDAGGLHTVAWLFTARSSNSSTGKIVPGDVLDKSQFDPDAVIVDFKQFAFNSKSSADPVDWLPLGPSNGSCWKDNAPGCGSTGWLTAQHTLAAGGSYRIELGVVNWGDQAYDSGLAFDIAGLSAPVPEPAAALLMLAGLAGLGAMQARRARRRAGQDASSA